MDILTHTLSGMAFGGVVANQFKSTVFNRLSIVAVGTVAGAMPDIDVITMWSGFDATFGEWFNLEISGRAAFGDKLWYSHHAFFHSMMAAILFGVILGGKLWLARTLLKKESHLKHILPFVAAFSGAYATHILEDMVTPGGGWGGVALWWPSMNYAGGYGYTWWWNNYDIFLIAFCVGLINIMLLFASSKLKKVVSCFSLFLFISGFSLGLFQIKTRGFDFAYRKNKTSSMVCEQKSKEIQKEVLGDTLYKWMAKFDEKIPVAF